MELRALARRCPSRSMTVLGDLAQATAPGATDSWPESIRHLGSPPTASIEELGLGYRVPEAIIEVANRLLPRVAPQVRPVGLGAAGRPGARPDRRRSRAARRGGGGDGRTAGGPLELGRRDRARRRPRRGGEGLRGGRDHLRRGHRDRARGGRHAAASARRQGPGVRRRGGGRAGPVLRRRRRHRRRPAALHRPHPRRAGAGAWSTPSRCRPSSSRSVREPRVGALRPGVASQSRRPGSLSHAQNRLRPSSSAGASR